MPLQTQSAALLPAQENLVQRSTKAVSFQTPGGAANKNSKTAGRRAFGDISNRKQSRPQSSKPEVTKPSQSKAASVRLERKPSASAPKAKASLSTKSTQKAKRKVYEEIERPYGPTGSQLDELYDSDGHHSVCSMEKEGFVFTRRDVADLLRQGMKERREDEDKFLESTWKSMDDDNAAFVRQDGTSVETSLIDNPKSISDG